MIRLSGLNEKAEAEKFVVAYPYGSGRLPNRALTFNAGNVGGYAMHNDVDDVGFTEAMLEELLAQYPVDGSRVYATGISNGGMMAYRVACELSDRFAAVASVAGPIGFASCDPVQPVGVLHFHGTGDRFAPYEGGYGENATGARGVTDFFSVAETVENWVAANQCIGEPTIEALPNAAEDGMRSNRSRWTECEAGAEVVLVTIENGGHTWPGREPTTPILGEATFDFEANDLIWEFFERHSR